MTITKNGVKCYPVCGFENNQHKIDYYYTKAINKCYDTDYSDEAVREREEIENLYDVFNSGVYKDGLVYVPWKFFQRIKELIVRYDLCH